MPGQVSVRKGEAGKSPELNKLHNGNIAQPYLTATGSLTCSEETTTVLPSITAFAQTKFLSFPAIAKPSSLVTLALSPSATWSKNNLILFPSIFISLYNARIDDVSAVILSKCPKSKSIADITFVWRMYIICLTDIDSNSHSGIR